VAGLEFQSVIEVSISSIYDYLKIRMVASHVLFHAVVVAGSRVVELKSCKVIPCKVVQSCYDARIFVRTMLNEYLLQRSWSNVIDTIVQMINLNFVNHIKFMRHLQIVILIKSYILKRKDLWNRSTDRFHFKMRFGKTCASLAEQPHMLPLVSYQVLKEIIKDMGVCLEKDDFTEDDKATGVRKLDEKFIEVFAADVQAVKERTYRDTAAIEQALAEFQFQGNLISLFVHPRQIEKIKSAMPLANISDEPIAAHVVRFRLQHPRIRQNVVDKLIESFNVIAKLVNELQEYLQANLAGFRKIIKKRARWVTGDYLVDDDDELGKKLQYTEIVPPHLSAAAKAVIQCRHALLAAPWAPEADIKFSELMELQNWGSECTSFDLPGESSDFNVSMAYDLGVDVYAKPTATPQQGASLKASGSNENLPANILREASNTSAKAGARRQSKTKANSRQGRKNSDGSYGGKAGYKGYDNANFKGVQGKGNAKGGNMQFYDPSLFASGAMNPAMMFPYGFDPSLVLAQQAAQQQAQQNAYMAFSRQNSGGNNFAVANSTNFAAMSGNGMPPNGMQVGPMQNSVPNPAQQAAMANAMANMANQKGGKGFSKGYGSGSGEGQPDQWAAAAEYIRQYSQVAQLMHQNSGLSNGGSPTGQWPQAQGSYGGTYNH
jgi:hypothetical protein